MNHVEFHGDLILNCCSKCLYTYTNTAHRRSVFCALLCAMTVHRLSCRVSWLKMRPNFSRLKTTSPGGTSLIALDVNEKRCRNSLREKLQRTHKKQIRVQVQSSRNELYHCACACLTVVQRRCPLPGSPLLHYILQLSTAPFHMQLKCHSHFL